VLVLKVLKQNEIVGWQAFHAAHKSEFVKERDPEQLARAARDKKLFVLRGPAGEIRGTCGCFEYGEQGDHREVGAVRVLDQGYGLQVLLMTAAVLSEWMFDPPNAPIVCATANTNLASQTNILRAGFLQVPSFSSACMQAMGLFNPNPHKAYFEFPLAGGIPNRTDYLLEIEKKGGIEKHNRQIAVRLEIPVLEVLRAIQTSASAQPR
jgi:hypothetical protein